MVGKAWSRVVIWVRLVASMQEDFVPFDTIPELAREGHIAGRPW